MAMKYRKAELEIQQSDLQNKEFLEFLHNTLNSGAQILLKPKKDDYDDLDKKEKIAKAQTLPTPIESALEKQDIQLPVNEINLGAEDGEIKITLTNEVEDGE